jgi:hypothetical protein
MYIDIYSILEYILSVSSGCLDPRSAACLYWIVSAHFAHDLDWSAVSLEYQEFASKKDSTSLKVADLIHKFIASNESYKNVCLRLAQILAAKPHLVILQMLNAASVQTFFCRHHKDLVSVHIPKLRLFTTIFRLLQNGILRSQLITG